MSKTPFLVATVLLALSSLFVSSCAFLSSPVPEITPGSALGNFEVVYVTANSDWSLNHSMSNLLVQEFERSGYAILRQDPPLILTRPALHLSINFVSDRDSEGSGRSDQLRHLELSLTRLGASQPQYPSEASYHGVSLDRLGQKKLAERIVAGLLRP